MDIGNKTSNLPKGDSMKLITESAVAYDANGYKQESGIEVYRLPETSDQCECYIIGGRQHRADELTVDLANCKIESVNGWSVSW